MARWMRFSSSTPPPVSATASAMACTRGSTSSVEVPIARNPFARSATPTRSNGVFLANSFTCSRSRLVDSIDPVRARNCLLIRSRFENRWKPDDSRPKTPSDPVTPAMPAPTPRPVTAPVTPVEIRWLIRRTVDSCRDSDSDSSRSCRENERRITDSRCDSDVEIPSVNARFDERNFGTRLSNARPTPATTVRAVPATAAPIPRSRRAMFSNRYRVICSRCWPAWRCAITCDWAARCASMFSFAFADRVASSSAWRARSCSAR